MVMAEKYPNLSSLVMDEDCLTLALNEEYVQTGEVINLKDGDTIALIPPISGG
jgi:molybdopterin converting factor small subunit